MLLAARARAGARPRREDGRRQARQPDPRRAINVSEGRRPELGPLVFPGQGIGAYPVILKDGGLGIAIDALSGGVPVVPGPDELDEEPGSEELVFIRAPAAGSTPWPAPLTFLPPVDVASNQSTGQPAQRGSEGLPTAAVDPDSGTIYAVWDDPRYRTDGTNDVLLTRSFDNGLTWPFRSG